MIHILGIRGAVAFAGALLPVVALVLYRRLSRVDDHVSVPEAALAQIAWYRCSNRCPPTSLEKLARAARREDVPARSEVVREGEAGDTFCVVVDGTLVVTSVGAQLNELQAGDFFGEIALLRDIPRTATVTAVTDSTLLVIRRLEFLSAVLGTLDSAATAEEIISRHLSDEVDGQAVRVNALVR